MRSIAYLSASSSYSHSLPAYGHLRALAERRCPEWEWTLLDKLVGDSPSQAAVEVAAMGCDLLVSTVYLFNRNWILEVTGRLAVLAPSCRIVLGGPEFLGGNHQFLAAHPEIDAVIRGDESALPELLARFADIDSWASIPGVCLIDHRTGACADGGRAEFGGQLDELPSPYDKGYFDPRKPFQHYETSRGCSSKCVFCTSSSSGGTRWHSVERVSSDLANLDTAGCRDLRVLDRTFNEKPSRAVELVELFNARLPHVRFHLEIDPSRVGKSFLDALRAAEGTRFHLEAGVQTLNAEVLRAAGRVVDPSKVREALAQLVSIPNVQTHADLIAGLPG